MACATTVEENCHHVSDLLSALEKRTNLLSEILLKAKKALEEEHDLVDGHVPVNPSCAGKYCYNNTMRS